MKFRPSRGDLRPLFALSLAGAAMLAGREVPPAATAAPLRARTHPVPGPGLLVAPPGENREAGGHVEPGVLDGSTGCAACRLVGALSPQLPAGSFTYEARALEDGVALRVTARFPGVRQALWRANVARGQLLAALRGLDPPPLCEACRARLERFRDLRIEARRLPDGVLLFYTSPSPDVVHALHEMQGDLPLQQPD